jgi:adhesin/invasin
MKKSIYSSIIIFLLSSQLAAEDIKQAATAKISSELNSLKNNYINNAITSLENLIIETIPNTEISITGAEELKPQWEVLTVQPLRDDGENITFFQGSLLRWDGDRDTINLGIGQRKFLLDKTVMLGANAFYDHEFQIDHSRTGLGLEMITSVGEARTNRYFANSNSRKNNNRSNAEEVALDGYDYEIGTHAPYIPDWKFFIKYFSWDKPNTNVDIEGYTYSTEFMTPFGLKLVAGLNKYDNSKDEQAFFSLVFSSSKTNKNKKIIQAKAYDLKSVEDQKLTKVRRQNKIINSSFSIKAGGY